MRLSAGDATAVWNSQSDVTTIAASETCPLRAGPQKTPKNQVIRKHKNSTLLAVLIAASGIYAQNASAEGDATSGETLAYTCLGCHGVAGYRNAYPSYRVPKLGGQKASYLVIALQGYRHGTRQHPTMMAQASSLTDQDIEDAAAYLATLGNATVAAGGTSGAGFEPAANCVACHGQNGISLSPSWPTLAGQHEDYLVHALNQYRDGSRTDAVMSPMAATLSEETVLQLAKYFAGLEGLETTAVK
jgi:cytochrome c553